MLGRQTDWFADWQEKTGTEREGGENTCNWSEKRMMYTKNLLVTVSKHLIKFSKGVNATNSKVRKDFNKNTDGEV